MIEHPREEGDGGKMDELMDGNAGKPETQCMGAE